MLIKKISGLDVSEEKIKLIPLKTYKALIITIILLVITHLVFFIAYYSFGYSDPIGLINRFNLDREVSIPTWFATIMLFVCSILLWIISQNKKTEKDRSAIKWKVLAFIFLYLSMDEGAAIHEMGGIIGAIIGLEGGIFHFSWWVFALPLLFLFGVYFFKFWLTLPPKTRFLFLLSAIIYIGGAIGIEMITSVHASKFGTDNLQYQFLVAIEEGLEKIGVTTFIYALLDYLLNQPSQPSIKKT